MDNKTGKASVAIPLTSGIFSFFSVYMFFVYSGVHWSGPNSPRQSNYSDALSQIGNCRIIFAALAIVWAVWSLRIFHLRWVSWCVLVLALTAALSAFIIM